MRTRTLIGVVILVLVAAACENADTATTTTPADSTTMTETTATAEATTTAATATTDPASTTIVTTVAPTTTEATLPGAVTTVEAAVSDVEAWLADDFASTTPPEGVLGPSEVVCSESGPVSVGSVLSCLMKPNTSPDLQLDEAGLVIYVLDATGRTAWTSGTDVPDSATGLVDALTLTGTDLMCKDLLDPEVMAFPFSGVGRPTDSAYFWSLVYWSLTGQPDRMDADHDGIPCETLYDPAVVNKVLAGGPVS